VRERNPSLALGLVSVIWSADALAISLWVNVSVVSGDSPPSGRSGDTSKVESLNKDQQTLRYVTNRGWWAPTLLLLIWLPAQNRWGQLSQWWPLDIVGLLLLVLILYVATHPILSFSPRTIVQRRGPFRVSIDLDDLQSVRVDTRTRQINAIDPQTGQPRQVNFYFKRTDDWAGKRPAQGLVLRDNKGHHLSLSFLRTGANQWGVYLLRSVRENPEVDLGPRVIETLERIVR
jgi:hypothetical protein